jgi:hypothetical protein
MTLIYSPPRTHRIELDYRSILQVLNTKWDDNQKSIWKIYDEVQRINKQDVQSMEAIANSLVQLRNIYRCYPNLDVSESPFQNRDIANNNQDITVSEMFNKQDVFHVLYNMLKELTSIQEEKNRSTASI